jgi:hypothetical protein
VSWLVDAFSRIGVDPVITHAVPLWQRPKLARSTTTGDHDLRRQPGAHILVAASEQAAANNIEMRLVVPSAFVLCA